jgi:hypothetical protein
MKYLVEFKSWNDESAMNEQEDPYYVWGFKANDQDASGTSKVGFSSLKSYNNYKAEGYPLAKGLTKDMSLLDWMNTEGFTDCEERVLKIVGDDQSKTALEGFKDFQKSMPCLLCMQLMTSFRRITRENQWIEKHH